MLRGVASLIHIQRMHHPLPATSPPPPPPPLPPPRPTSILLNHRSSIDPTSPRARPRPPEDQTFTGPFAKFELQSSFQGRLMFRRFVETEKRKLGTRCRVSSLDFELPETRCTVSAKRTGSCRGLPRFLSPRRSVLIPDEPFLRRADQSSARSERSGYSWYRRTMGTDRRIVASIGGRRIGSRAERRVASSADIRSDGTAIYIIIRAAGITRN